MPITAAADDCFCVIFSSCLGNIRLDLSCESFARLFSLMWVLIESWVIFYVLLSSADFFSKLTFFKHSFRNAIRVSNGLDPDQDQRSVGPDLGPNCLQRSSADDKSCRQRGKSQGIRSHRTD